MQVFLSKLLKCYLNQLFGRFFGHFGIPINIQLVHSIRKDLFDQRMPLVKQTRGLLSERGIVINQVITQIREQL